MTNENKINDGGPAFPTEARTLFPTNKASFWCDGMSLRDWFAGMALQGLLSNFDLFDDEDSTLSTKYEGNAVRMAYAIANEMLKEREKKKESTLDEMVKENQEMGLYDEVKYEKATV